MVLGFSVGTLGDSNSCWRPTPSGGEINWCHTTRSGLCSVVGVCGSTGRSLAKQTPGRDVPRNRIAFAAGLYDGRLWVPETRPWSLTCRDVGRC